MLYSNTENFQYFVKLYLSLKLILSAFPTREMATQLHSQNKLWHEGKGTHDY